jgi:hypothetical protein
MGVEVANIFGRNCSNGKRTTAATTADLASTATGTARAAIATTAAAAKT